MRLVALYVAIVRCEGVPTEVEPTPDAGAHVVPVGLGLRPGLEHHERLEQGGRTRHERERNKWLRPGRERGNHDAGKGRRKEGLRHTCDDVQRAHGERTRPADANQPAQELCDVAQEAITTPGRHGISCLLHVVSHPFVPSM